MNELQVGDGLVPANAGGIPWWFPEGEEMATVKEPRFQFDIEFDLEPLQAMVQLDKREGDAYQPVAARVEQYGFSRYLVRPEVPWTEGERYRLSADPSRAPQPADAISRVVEFEIVGALEGEGLEPVWLNVSELRQAELGLFDGSGPCGRGEQAAYVDIDFPVPEGAPRWPGLFLDYTTLVDGAVWSPLGSVCQEIEPGGSWVSRTGNRLASPCDQKVADGRNSLAEGSFVVRMEARLPGSDVVVHSEEAEIELACTSPSSGAVESDATRAATTSSTAPGTVSHCSVSPASGTRPGLGRVTLGFGSLLLAVAVWRARARPRATATPARVALQGVPGVPKAT